jgi:cytochrome c biogenesis factor
VQHVFAPIALAAAVVFGLSAWALTALGAGAWWLWKKRPTEESDRSS